MQDGQLDRRRLGKYLESGEGVCLIFAAIPLSVYVLASVIFELGGFGLTGLGQKMAAALGSSQDITAVSMFAESRARLLWMATILLYYLLAAAVIALAFFSLRRSLSPRGFKFVSVIGGVLALITLGQLVYSVWNETALGAIYRFTFESLQNSHRFLASELARVKAMVTIVNVIAAIVPFAIMLAGCSTLAPLAGTDPSNQLRHIEGQMRRLKMVVNIGSAMLVAGVLHMLAWLRWPIVFLGDPDLANQINDWSLALTIYWGAVFSLMIVTLYTLCSLVLIGRVETALGQVSSKLTYCDVQEWLEKHGFSSAPVRQIPQILAVLAPLLAGPVGSALTGLGSSSG
jgi:hypothetical protein